MMTSRSRRAAFTLIEVLVVVVIMAILAAAIIPQFSSSTKDARESNLRYNVQTLRTQIEMYRVQHNNTFPDGTQNLKQLTSASDVSGGLSSTGQPDATHPYGPYIQGAIPNQPFSDSNTVRLDTGMAGTTPTATAAPGGGWIYRASTGQIWIDHPDYLSW